MIMGTMMNDNNIGSEQTNNSEGYVMPSSAFRMVEKEMEVLIIRTFQRVIEPMMGNLIRKVVQEEFELAQEKLMFHQTRNVTGEASTSRSGHYALQFLGNVSSPVLTGKEIKGEGDTPLRIALVDVSTGQIVESGPEASGKVEVVVLEANHKDHQKKRPILSENIIHLEKGAGHLGIKFKHEKSWMRSCECILVARFVDNIGIRVEEAKTSSFIVMDSRNRLYGKHHPPSLLDFVWRLETISRNGAIHKRLNEAQIITVKDFLISLFRDPEKLRKILDTNATTWKVLIDHAQTCTVDDEKVHLYSCGEGETVVVFDVVGRLQGILRNYQYIRVTELSEDEKADMVKSIVSAFKHWEDVSTFDDEASLLHCLSLISNGIFSQNIPRLDVCESSHVYDDQTQPGTSSQYSVPSMSCFGRTSSFGYAGSLSSYNNLNDQLLGGLEQGPNYSTFDLGMVVEDYDFHDHAWFLSFDNNGCDSRVQFCAYQESGTSDFQVVDDEAPSSRTAKKRWRMVAISVKKRSTTKRIINLIGARVQKKRRRC